MLHESSASGTEETGLNELGFEHLHFSSFDF
jgi:hypothetical protein